MPINLSNPVFTIVDVAQQRATSIQSSQVQQGSRTVPTTFVSEATIENDEWQRSRTVLTDTQASQHLHELNTPPSGPEPPANRETSTNAATAQPSPNVAFSYRTIPLHGSRTRNSARTQQTEEQMLKEVLVRGGQCFSRLSEPLLSGDNTLRVVHLTYSRRTFAMLTAKVRKPDQRITQPFGCIFWQTSISPPKAVAITMYTEQDSNISTPRFSAVCSCKPALPQSVSDHQSCSHLKAVLQPSNVSDLFRCTLLNHNTFQSSRNVFGRTINGDHSNYHFSTVQLMGRTAQSNSQQRTQDRKARFLTMFDHSRLRFVPLVLEKKKKVQCLLCRGHRSRRGPCEHEINCEQYYFRLPNNEQEFDGNMSDFSSEDSDKSDNEERNRYRDYSVPLPDVEVMQYSRTDVKIPLLPCKNIQLSSFLTACTIEQKKGREIIQMEDWFGICKFCKFQRSLQSLAIGQSTFRETRLFTLSQQVAIIKVEDWKCPQCSRQVRFTGGGRSIFPVRKSYCFTYELMYYFVHNVCRLGISFRAQYSSYHLSQISDSARARFDNFESTGMTPMEDYHSGRRRCAEAFNYFIRCLDTSDPKLCTNLFSCNNCERPLNAREKVLLGYGNNEEVNEKRFDAIVIDGTTAGILNALPNYDRDTKVLGTNSSIYRNQRFITSKMFQNAVKSVIKLIRSRIRTIVSRKRVLHTPSSTLSFKIPTHFSGKSKKKLSICKENLACLRKYLMDESCFCPRARSRTTSSHTALCRKVRREFDKSVCGDDIRHFIRSVVKMHRQKSGSTNQVAEEESTPEEDPGDSNISIVDEEYDGNPDDTEGSSSSDSNQSDESSESSESEHSFTYDPMSGHEASMDYEEAATSDYDDTSTHQHKQQQHNETFFITLDIPNPSRCGQVFEAFLEVMEFLLTDNASLPYIRPCGHQSLENGTSDTDQADIAIRNMILFNNDGNLKFNEEVIGYDSFRLHENLATKLEGFADCQCNADVEKPERHSPCFQCTHHLASVSEKCSEVNPIFSRFSDQLIFHSAVLKEMVSIISSNFAAAVREHVAFAENYFEHLTSNLESSCKEYWTAFAGCKLQPLRYLTEQTQNGQENGTSTTNNNNNDQQPTSECATPVEDGNNASNSNSENDTENVENVEDGHAQQSTFLTNRDSPHNQRSNVPDRSPFTGISFPGREHYRPLFTFDLREGHHCGKRYPQNSNHSPGLLTVMCACSNPKLIGYIVMDRCESTALALSIALMFFKIPPCTIFYDNGCNALASALLRLPWLLLFSFIVVDRFHYKGHSCNSFFDADRYSVLDRFKSSSAESMNAKIKQSLHHMRFLRGENLVYYLNARFALLNLEAKYYEINATRDAEDANMNKFFANIIDCSCATCACEEAMNALISDPMENNSEPELD